MSYTTIWVHCVWSTKYREHTITKAFRPVLLEHIRKQAKEKGIYLDYINAHLDHVHALINIGREQTISDIMKLLKGESSYWVNKMKVMNGKFYWQDDYFAVSISESHVERVRNYIKSQDVHHKKRTWNEEVGLFLEKYNFQKDRG